MAIDPDPDDFDAAGPIVRTLATIEQVPTVTIRAGERFEGTLTYDLKRNGEPVNGVKMDVTVKGAPPPLAPGGGRSFIHPGERPPVGRRLINPEEE